MADIDKLSIEIESNSDSAVKSIDKLINALQGLNNGLPSGAKMNKVADALSRIGSAGSNDNGSLTSLSNSLKSLNDVDTRNINKIAKSITKLNESVSGYNGGNTNFSGLASSLSGLGNIDKSVATTLNSLSRLDKVVAGLSSSNLSAFSKGMTSLSSSLKPLADVGKINLGSTLNQLKKLPTTINMLDKADLSKFTNQMKQLANAIKPLADKSVKLTNIFGKLPNAVDKASSSLEKYDKKAQKSGNSSKSLLSKLQSLSNGISTIKRLVTGGLLGSLFEESSQYVENLNLFSVAMGDATEKAKAFVDTVSEAMGIDPSEWMKYQGSMNMMVRGFGVASDKAQIMSQNLTQLAYDYSSLMNIDVESAFDKISSAMSGQIKGLKEFGNNVSVAMVKETGLRYGLQGAPKDWDQNTQAIMRYITIMNNASKVDVFNDMARTINTPANAVRILTQQFTMLKRSIGNIASVFATAVIPYIQTAVSLLNKFATFIAGIFGFELPKIDYSDISAGAGAMDDLADSTDSAGDSSDKASKKVKKLKKELQTLGFDELNILNSPNDDSSSGSGGSGSGSGTGGGSIGDIELPQYDFLKGLEKSTDALEKKLKELFKPISDSWSMYGKDVMDSFEFKWNQIGKLTKSIGTSFNEVWQNGTGQRSVDEILQTVTHLNNTVGYLAKRFREAWDSASTGTKIVQSLWNSFNIILTTVRQISKLLEDFAFNLDFKPLLNSVLSLSKAFEGLVNVLSKYVKDVFKNILIPLAKWGIEKVVPTIVEALADALDGISGALRTLRPLISVLEKLFTAVFKLAGNVILAGIKALGKALEVVGNSKVLLSALIGVVTALVVALNFNKAINGIQTLIGTFNNLKTAVGLVKELGLGMVLQMWGTSADGTSSKIATLLQTFAKLNSTTGIFQGVSGAITTLGKSLGVMSVEATGAVTSTGLLGGALSFLAANPLVAVAGGIAIATGALVLFSSGMKEHVDVQKEELTSAKKLTDKLKEQASEWKKANKEARDSALAGQENTLVAQDYASRLYDIVDANGKVTGSVNSAKAYVEELNSRLGTNIEIHDGVIQNWEEEKQKINEAIEALKREAEIEAYREQYIEAKKQENDAQIQLNNAKAKYNESLEKEKEYRAQIDEAIANGVPASYELQKQYQNQCAITGEYGKAVESAESKVTSINEALNNYNKAIQTTDGTVESSTAFIVEQYGVLAKDGSYTYSSLVNGLNELGKKCNENGDVWKTLSKTEQEASKKAREQLLSDLATKAYKQGKTYEEMLSTAKTKGAQLTDADKQELKKQYNNLVKQAEDIKKTKSQQNKDLLALLDKYRIDKESKTAKRYQKELKEAQKNGTEQGKAYIDELAKKISSDSPIVSDKAGEVGKDSKEKFEKHKADFKVDTKSATDSISNALSTIPSSKTMKLKLTTDTKTLKIGDQGFGIKLFAKGGFPDTGQMFIAREAGPELVGRIGRKTAVANNDQIVQGIASAVRGAMSGVGTPNGGTTRIVVQNVLDGRQIGESVIEYHNGKVKQTGQSPLMF